MSELNEINAIITGVQKVAQVMQPDGPSRGTPPPDVALAQFVLRLAWEVKELRKQLAKVKSDA